MKNKGFHRQKPVFQVPKTGCLMVLGALGNMVSFPFLSNDFLAREARNGVEKWLSAEGGVEEYMVKTMRAEVKKGGGSESVGVGMGDK